MFFFFQDNILHLVNAGIYAERILLHVHPFYSFALFAERIMEENALILKAKPLFVLVKMVKILVP